MLFVDGDGRYEGASESVGDDNFTILHRDLSDFGAEAAVRRIIEPVRQTAVVRARMYRRTLPHMPSDMLRTLNSLTWHVGTLIL